MKICLSVVLAVREMISIGVLLGSALGGCRPEPVDAVMRNAGYVNGAPPAARARRNSPNLATILGQPRSKVDLLLGKPIATGKDCGEPFADYRYGKSLSKVHVLFTAAKARSVLAKAPLGLKPDQYAALLGFSLSRDWAQKTSTPNQTAFRTATRGGSYRWFSVLTSPALKQNVATLELDMVKERP